MELSPPWALDFTHFVEDLVFLLIVLLELFGTIVIGYGAFIDFVQFFLLRFTESSTALRVKLARTISLGLEFFLAAEIFKTIVIRELRDLYIIAAIIALRGLMAILVHWEIRHDLKFMKDEIEAMIKQEQQDGDGGTAN